MRLPIHINEQSAEPLYYQITVQLRALILSGQLVAGEQLPSIRELAQAVKCSVITIKRVYNDLENEGLIRTRQGTGTFVSDVSTAKKDEQRLATVEIALDDLMRQAEQVQVTKDELQQLFHQKLDQFYT
ncbi:GntR family transcriptional regulator [Paenibacillus yanchengensis]|uniref:GntR family transcriptional regulator n=1 Tax=Paenibacillus yanchengensis TaxID=2035833 RepID=A0ABW4YJP7_9BACL